MLNISRAHRPTIVAARQPRNSRALAGPPNLWAPLALAGLRWRCRSPAPRATIPEARDHVASVVRAPAGANHSNGGDDGTLWLLRPSLFRPVIFQCVVICDGADTSSFPPYRRYARRAVKEEGGGRARSQQRFRPRACMSCSDPHPSAAPRPGRRALVQTARSRAITCPQRGTGSIFASSMGRSRRRVLHRHGITVAPGGSFISLRRSRSS